MLSVERPYARRLCGSDAPGSVGDVAASNVPDPRHGGGEHDPPSGCTRCASVACPSTGFIHCSRLRPLRAGAPTVGEDGQDDTPGYGASSSWIRPTPRP